MDNSQGEAKQVIYTRRPRLLDEELLDDDKDISGNLPIKLDSSQASVSLPADSANSNQSNNQKGEIFSTNKTDSEKFNEIQNKEVSVSAIISPEEKSPVVMECEAKTFKNSDSVSSESEFNDSIILRRQQLTRVAEWVQNSSNIPLPNSPAQTAIEILNDSNTINKQIKLDLENNNSSVAKSNYASMNNQVYKEVIPLCEITAQNGVAEKLNADSNTSVLSSLEYAVEQNDSTAQNDEKIDLAQMEYNVKKFLLKQNEWSMNRILSSDSYSKASSESKEETIFIKSSYQRTETNL